MSAMGYGTNQNFYGSTGGDNFSQGGGGGGGFI